MVFIILLYVTGSVLSYGYTMGAHKEKYSGTLGVDSFAIKFCVMGGVLSWLGLFVSIVTYGTNAWSWQMRRSYPTNPKYVKYYIMEHGEIN